MFRSVKPSPLTCPRQVRTDFQILGGTTKKTEPKRVLSFLLLVYTLDVTVRYSTGQI